MLAATMSLKTRKMSPQSKIRERKGFVTASRVPDCFEDKANLAKSLLMKKDRATGMFRPRVNEYSPPRDHVFRQEKEIERGMIDFHLRVKPEPIPNPKGLSAFEQRPKYQVEYEKKRWQEQEDFEKFQRLGQG